MKRSICTQSHDPLIQTGTCLCSRSALAVCLSRYLCLEHPAGPRGALVGRQSGSKRGQTGVGILCEYPGTIVSRPAPWPYRLPSVHSFSFPASPVSLLAPVAESGHDFHGAKVVLCLESWWGSFPTPLETQPSEGLVNLPAGSWAAAPGCRWKETIGISVLS